MDQKSFVEGARAFAIVPDHETAVRAAAVNRQIGWMSRVCHDNTFIIPFLVWEDGQRTKAIFTVIICEEICSIDTWY